MPVYIPHQLDPTAVFRPVSLGNADSINLQDAAPARLRAAGISALETGSSTYGISHRSEWLGGDLLAVATPPLTRPRFRRSYVRARIRWGR